MQTSQQPPRLRRLVWPLLWMAALFAVLVVALRSVPSSYRRFVSKPLGDGSRYTFLYPAYLKDVQEDGKGASPEVTHNAMVTRDIRAESVWNQLRMGFGFRFHSSAEEMIEVVVIPVKQGHVQDSRSHEELIRGSEHQRTEYLMDARTKSAFLLWYHCDPNSLKQFERNHHVVARSLQVLPPGTAPPTP